MNLERWQPSHRQKERASDAVHLYNTSVDGGHTVDDMGARRVSDADINSTYG